MYFYFNRNTHYSIGFSFGYLNAKVFDGCRPNFNSNKDRISINNGKTIQKNPHTSSVVCAFRVEVGLAPIKLNGAWRHGTYYAYASAGAHHYKFKSSLRNRGLSVHSHIQHPTNLSISNAASASIYMSNVVPQSQLLRMHSCYIADT